MQPPLVTTRLVRSVLLAVIFAPLSAAISCVPSQHDDADYPNRAVEIIVPFAPGGGSDTFARILKAEVEEQGLLSHPLVIVNAPGAGGTIGSRRAMHEDPDGYSVLLLHDAILTAKFSGKALYGPEAFEQVAGTGLTGMVVAVHEESNLKNLDDLLTKAASEPDSLTFAANLGAPSHFIGLMLEQAQGAAKFRFAQIGGGADRFSSIKGKHAVVTAFSLEEFLRFQPEGVKALAFLGDDRHWRLPDTPTAIEQGFDVQNSVMQYWWMPKNTPLDRRQTFAAILQKVMTSKRFQDKLEQMKIEPLFITGDQLANHLIEAEASLGQVDPGSESPLPNLPLTLAGLAVVFGVGMVSFRWRQETTKESEETSVMTAWVIAVGAMLLSCLYAVIMIVFGFPLGATTALFVLLLGSAISLRDRSEHRWRSVAIVLAFSAGLGGLFHLVFTRLFEIGL